ncbi:hypothetical protein B0H11DRAFT_253467 [Mycena galericulata]|nr:hypothetical protein B0H11DRAFT_253467 [Mycena galericulata]
MSDPLAVQLNDLAIANSDGLLNDDEYRLLRQNLFERYSGGVEILSVSSTPPTVKPASAAVRRKHVELVEQVPPRAQSIPTRSKTSAVADFLRRATGRKSPPAPTSVIKLSILPRLFSKKSEDTLSSDTDSSGRHSSSPSYSRKASSGDVSPPPNIKPKGLGREPTSPTSPTFPTRSTFERPPTSPSRSAFAISTPSKHDVIPGGSKDIFDDDNLQTSEDIRKAITAVENEARRLVTAFNDLETSAVIRYRREHSPRTLSSATTTNPPRPSLSPNGSHTSANRSRSNSHRHNPPSADTQSVRSSNSLRTSKSTASLFHSSSPPQSTPSAWNALSPRRLRRKGSESSLSSAGTPSFLSASRAAAPAPLNRISSTLSRSTGHLPLPVPAHRHGSGSTMMELLSHTPPGEGGEELAEVRRRRAEMVGRCESRLEYLRAKLKGAELHEKLLRN